MKKIYHFRLQRDEFEKLNDAPVQLVTNKNNMVVVIEIDENDPNFHAVYEWIKKQKHGLVVGGMAVPRYIFKGDELDDNKYLFIDLLHLAPGEMYAEEYGTEYHDVCKDGRFDVKEQTSDLFINTNNLSKNYDIQNLLSEEIIISNRLADILKANKVTGYEARPIYHVSSNSDYPDRMEAQKAKRKLSDGWQQLIITSEADLMHKTTAFGYDFIDFFNKKNTIKHYYKKCNLITGIKDGSAPYYSRKNWPCTDFVKSKEKIISQYPYPLIYLSNKLYRLFRDNKIKGIKYRPIYFVD